MNRIFIFIEIALFVLIMALCWLWFKDPDSNIEPIVVACSLGIPVLEFIRRTKMAVRKSVEFREQPSKTIHPMELPDEQFEMVNKFIELPLATDTYRPENSYEESACASLSNIGFLEYDNGVYRLTPTGKQFMETYGKHA